MPQDGQSTWVLAQVPWTWASPAAAPPPPAARSRAFIRLGTQVLSQTPLSTEAPPPQPQASRAGCPESLGAGTIKPLPAQQSPHTLPLLSPSKSREISASPVPPVKAAEPRSHTLPKEGTLPAPGTASPTQGGPSWVPPAPGHGACCSLCSFCVFSVCCFLSGGGGGGSRWA